jgi:hypothetical protein
MRTTLCRSAGNNEKKAGGTPPQLKKSCSTSLSIKNILTATVACAAWPERTTALGTSEMSPANRVDRPFGTTEAFAGHGRTGLIKREDDDWGPFGTNQNLPGFAQQDASQFGLVGPEVAMVNALAQPGAPGAQDECSFIYKPFLSGSKASTRVPFRRPAPFEPTDVKQGGIGDCGLGAALLALRGNNQNSVLSRTLTQVAFPPEKPVYRAIFYATGTAVDVFIDDYLPTVDTSDGVCERPESPASYRAPHGNYYVPLFEKAWAKYVDAHMQFATSERRDEDAHGYLALTSMPAMNVLRGVTGRSRKAVHKTKTGDDYKFLQAIMDCLNGPQTCVFSSVSANNLEKAYGPPNRFDVYSASGGRVFRNNDHTYTLVDTDQDNTRLTLVGDHAYALMRSQSNRVTGSASFKPNKVLVTIRNPWGCNPDAESENSCAQSEGDVLISLRGLAAAMDAVYTLA